MSGQGLEIVRRDDEVIELVDNAIGTWIVRMQPISESAIRSPQSTAALGTAVVQGLANQLPELSRLMQDLSKSSGALSVVFSPEVTSGLAKGTYKLMGSALQMPLAIGKTGKVVEIAKVVPGVSAVSSGGALKGAGGAVLLGTSWPVLLAVGVGVAAAWAEHRWLEKTFDALQSSMNAIHLRLRDDDVGALLASDHLVGELYASDVLLAPPQLSLVELSVARQRVNSIYLSRKRFADRFIERMQHLQNQHEERTGERRGWVGDLSDDLVDKGAGEELVIYLAAMISRARITSATAAVLVGEGQPLLALSMIEQEHESLRSDYFNLYRRIRALARTGPSEAGWKRVVPLLGDGDGKRAHEFVKGLASEMEKTVGKSLPESREPLVLEAYVDDRFEPSDRGLERVMLEN